MLSAHILSLIFQQNSPRSHYASFPEMVFVIFLPLIQIATVVLSSRGSNEYNTTVLRPWEVTHSVCLAMQSYWLCYSIKLQCANRLLRLVFFGHC